MKFQVAKSGNWSVVFNEEAGRFSLSEGDKLALSSMLYSDCAARALEKGAKLEPVAFGGWTSAEGKPVKVNPKDGAWEVEVGGSVAQTVESIGSAIRAAQAKTVAKKPGMTKQA